MAYLSVLVSTGECLEDELRDVRPAALPSTHAVLLEGESDALRRLQDGLPRRLPPPPPPPLPPARAASPARPLPLLPSLSAFGWQSWKDDNWWRTLRGQVPELAASGVTHLWLPPPSQSVSFEGYLPGQVLAREEAGGRRVDWLQQGIICCNSNQSDAMIHTALSHFTPCPSTPPQLYNLSSRYGTEEELRALCGDLLRAGIRPMADIVINHRCADEQDESGAWTVYR